jgi:hypothetical protein
LPLEEYGRYSLAIQVANGILLISSPIISAILPRLTILESEKNNEGLIELYRYATHLVVIAAGAASITMAFFSEALIWLWTGDADLSKQVSPILTLYAIGNGLVDLAEDSRARNLQRILHPQQQNRLRLLPKIQGLICVPSSNRLPRNNQNPFANNHLQSVGTQTA